MPHAPKTSPVPTVLAPIRLAGCVVAAVALVLNAYESRAADAANGEKLARLWCASCHVVAPDQQRANADAPPFASIGKKPGFSADQFAVFLLEPHPKMPNMELSRFEAGDLAAYIAQVSR
jgi:mono/diheme cytochrome c family protein